MSDSTGSTGPNPNQHEKHQHAGDLPEQEGRERPLPEHESDTPLYQAEPGMSVPHSPETMDLTPEELALIEAHRAKREHQEKKKHRGVAAVIGGVVATALIGGGVALLKITDGDDEHASQQPVPGATVKPSTGERSPVPSSEPTDIESSINNSAEEHERSVAERRALFKNQAIKGEQFTPLLISEKTFNNLHAKDASFPSEQKARPGFDVLPPKLMTAESLEQAKNTLDKAFEDGTVAKALEELNRTHGTHLTIEDLMITKSEIPNGSDKAATKAFLNKLALMPDIMTAVALTVSKNSSDPEAGKPFLDAANIKGDKSIYESYIIAMNHGDDPEVKEARYRSYTLATVINNSSLLVSNVDGRGTQYQDVGVAIDGEGDATDPDVLHVPVFGVYSETQRSRLLDGMHYYDSASNFDLMTTVPASEKAAGGKKDASYALLIRDTPVSIG